MKSSLTNHPQSVKRFGRSICCLLLALPVAHATEKVVLYGDENYPPYSYMENGRFTGIDVDILRLAAILLSPQYQIQLAPIPWKRGLAMMEKGRAFGLFPPGRKLDRTYIDQYSIPILRESVVVFCNRLVMRTSRRNFPEDFAGLTIGINAGFLLSDRLVQAANAGIVILERKREFHPTFQS
jgi:polar amino acid transport system substrate-binding protein